MEYWFTLTSCSTTFLPNPNSNTYKIANIGQYKNEKEAKEDLLSRFFEYNKRDSTVFIPDLKEKEECETYVAKLFQDIPINTLVKTRFYGNRDCCCRYLYKSSKENPIFTEADLITFRS